MKITIDTYNEMLTRRLQGIRAITQSLGDSHQALLSRDVDRLQQLTAQQQMLCGEVDFLDAEINGVRNELEPALQSNGGESETTAALMASAESELVRAYKVNAALLRRARRAVNVMINVAQSEANAYCSPSSYRSLQMGEE
jgi:cell division septum initiation protein DivIVA